jgi:hypothetical protein
VRSSAADEWRTIVTWPFEELSSVVGFNQAGDRLYVESSLGSDTARLVEVDAATGQEVRTLAQDPKCDVGDVHVNSRTRVVEAVEFDYQISEWRVLDPAVEQDYRAIQAGVSLEDKKTFSVVSPHPPRTHKALL